MERVDLPLAKLTLAQKLDLIETLWDDIIKDEKAVESPRWYEEVLQDRQEALEAGKAVVHDWDEAKERIRRNVSRE
jgi:putative addiction module component (TIGR02574 family)